MRVCDYCIATKGLKGSDLVKGSERDMDDDEKYLKHLEDEHNLPVRRENETEKETLERFYREHPEARDPATCKCPSCKAKRGDNRDVLVESFRALKNTRIKDEIEGVDDTGFVGYSRINDK